MEEIRGLRGLRCPGASPKSKRLSSSSPLGHRSGAKAVPGRWTQLDPATLGAFWEFHGEKNYLKKPQRYSYPTWSKKQLAIENPRIFKFGKPSSSIGHFPVSKLLVYQRVSLAKFI